MTPQTIEIIVTPTGETTVRTNGFAGASCRHASKFIEQSLGKQTGERLTSEFYQSARTHRQAHEQG